MQIGLVIIFTFVDMDNTIEVKLDKNDLKLMFDALCYFDMDHDGTGYYTDALNDSLHYLYSISKKVGLDDN